MTTRCGPGDLGPGPGLAAITSQRRQRIDLACQRRPGAAAADAPMTMARPATALESLQRRCQGLATAETARLSRRVPGLQAEQLGEVEAALWRVVERLVASRAHTVRADQLTALFDLEDAT